MNVSKMSGRFPAQTSFQKSTHYAMIFYDADTAFLPGAFSKKDNMVSSLLKALNASSLSVVSGSLQGPRSQPSICMMAF